MPAARARRLLDILVDIGAVLPRPDGLVVAAWQPSAAEGLRLAGFLANVATVFERPADADDDDEVLLEDGLVLDLPPRPAASGRPRRSREPVVVAAVTMVAAVLATLAPTSGPPTALRTVTSASAASAVADGAPSLDLGPGGERVDAPSTGTGSGDVAGGGDQPSSPSPAVAPTLPMPAPGLSGATTGGAPSALDGRAETAEPSATPSGPLSAGRSPAPAPGPTSPTPVGPTPPGAPPAGAPVVPEPVVCPAVQVPYVLVESVLVSPGPTDALAGLAAPAVLEVSGTMVNPSEGGVVIRSYEITVELDDGRATVPGSPAPLTVPAAGQQAWRMATTVPAGSTAGEGDVAARVLQWEWLDDAVAEACPT